MLRRMRILADLEPLRHLTRAEVLDLYRDRLISAETYRLKVNFPAYIRRFERENTNISSFGEALAYDRKIAIIAAKLMEYSKEDAAQSTTINNE